MQTKAFLVAAILLGVTASASVVRAEPGLEMSSSSPDRRDRSRVGVNVGLFTPGGELSVEYAQALHPNLELAISGGVGAFVRVGPQISIMPRARVRRGPLTLSAGAGVSGGQFNNVSAFADENAPKITSLFGNGEVGVQLTSQRGPYVRAFLGASTILAHASYVPHNEMEKSEVNGVLPYGGVSAGWAF
jgi:hypothetical protein